MWILLVALYGILKGARDVMKKKALERSSAMEVLFGYTLFSFLFVTPSIKDAVAIDTHYLGFIVIKSLIIFIAWICSFKAIEKLPVGFYGIMDMSRVIFATLLGIFVLNEILTVNKIMGMVLVLLGLLFVNIRFGQGKSENVKPFFLVLTLISCFLNAVSELLDKMLMQHITSGQLQFWYMFFLVVLYLIYMITTKTKFRMTIFKDNPWILLLSILFVIGDKALFIACESGESTVIAMTLIKQCSVLVTIIGGRLVFKEKNTLYKLFCAAIIITGILVAIM